MSWLWHKKGYLVPIALITSLIIELSLFGWGYSLKEGSTLKIWIGRLSIASLFLPALINYLLTKFLVDDNQVKEVKESDEKIILVKRYSTFLGIRNKTWTKIFFYGIILTIICVIILGSLGWARHF